MTMQPGRCSELPLEVLLADRGDGDGGDAGDEFRALENHLAVCETCQTRLTTLAADANWWSDARELLSGDWEASWVPDVSRSELERPARAEPRPSLEAVARELLSPPSHPEMLGRLGWYDIERVIGSGGMGIVLKAHDSELNRPIAIKMLAAHLAHVGAARERFAREGRAAAAVVHEHVVAIYNVESDGAVPFLVMQYVPGRSLQSRVDEEGPLAVEEILRIGMQAASGLAAAHAQGLVHRDVKPSNILLEESVERAVLTDFGLARAIDDASLTQTGVLAGTPHYMSPEQATGGPIDHRSDLFSLGVVIYFMATGHPPFRAEGALAVLHRICRERHRPVWEWNKDVPDELSDLVEQLLEKKPSRRPASAADVEKQLAAMLSRIQQYGLGRRRFGGLRSRRARRRLAGAIAATLVIAAAIGALTWIPTTPPPAGDGPPPISTKLAAAAQQASTLDGQFVNELQQALSSLEHLEQPSYFAVPGDDGWHRELEQVEQELSRVEAFP